MSGRVPALEATQCSPAQDLEFDATTLGAILAIVRERSGVDFTCYRRAALVRRIRNRMLSMRIDQPDDYLEFLRHTTDEAQQLLERLTIKVSRFYRHAPGFDCLRHSVLPELQRAASGRPLRIRSVGCSTGEEAWSLAMLLDEAQLPGLVEASDIDARALAEATLGIYRTDALEELPASLAERYLEPAMIDGATRYRVCASLRERVRFTLQDITATQDAAAAATRYDLVCCRNVLIYLERSTQERVLRALVGTLRAGGYLCLGEAEWPPPAVAGSLRAFERGTRVFQLPVEGIPGGMRP